MKKVLLVDDDDIFRTALKERLDAKGFHVTAASDGKAARDLLQMSDFDLVISDIQMPHLSGVELLQWVKANKKCKVVLITGFSQLLETQSAYDRGADGFLTKPFREDDLFGVLSKLFPGAIPDSAVDQVKATPHFCRVPIDDFLTSKDSLFEIFVKVSDTKYVKVSHQGGKLSEERIAVFKAKGVFHVFIKLEDFDKLVNFNLLLAKSLDKNEKVDPVKKANFMKSTADLILERVFVKGIDSDLFKNSTDFVFSTMSLVTEQTESFDLLHLLSTHSDYLYAHSLGVSTFSVMIGKKMGWEAPSTLFKLAFGGLFHDIGKKEIDRQLLEKSRVAHTQEERKILEAHPMRGAEILSLIKGVPSDVILMASQHHEDIHGQGYPRRITENHISPLARVVAVANAFCNLTIKNPNMKDPLDGPTAIVHLEQFMAAGFDQNAFAALKKLIA